MQPAIEEVISIPKRKIRNILNNPKKAMDAISLVYVDNTEQGIIRIKKGDTFNYLLADKEVKDTKTLQRIKSLVIPPAWESVWICRISNGHLQATGLDAKNRKQYKYHSLWNIFRNQAKFYHIYDFGKRLPDIRLQLEKDISLPGLSREKVLATIVSLMERTNIRIGNNFYEKLYGSFGLTTLKDKHIKLNGNKLYFSFKGKKSVYHNISINNKKLISIVLKCKDIPGKELFQYYDENNERKPIDSGMVNDYIKNISGGDFTAKDFRTWSGTIHGLITLKELGDYETEVDKKKNITTMLNTVAEQLGNTPAVCKKYYVHPALISLYENKTLEKYLQQLNAIEIDDNKTGLTAMETILMNIIKTN
jgi:DNA topoisomerase-1